MRVGCAQNATSSPVQECCPKATPSAGGCLFPSRPLPGTAGRGTSPCERSPCVPLRIRKREPEAGAARHCVAAAYKLISEPNRGLEPMCHETRVTDLWRPVRKSPDLNEPPTPRTPAAGRTLTGLARAWPALIGTPATINMQGGCRPPHANRATRRNPL